MGSTVEMKAASSKNLLIEEQASQKKPNNPFLSVTFWWLLPILRGARQSALELKKLFEIDESLLAEENGDMFARAWKAEVERTKGKPSFLKTIIFGVDKFSWIYLVSILYILRTVCLLMQPVVFLFLLKYYVDPEANLGAGFGYVIALALLALIGSIFEHQYQWRAQLAQIKVRSGIMSYVYSKALRLSIRTEDQTGITKWVSAMSVDAENVRNMVEIFGALIWTPLEVLGIAAIMITIIGVSTLAGLAFLLISVILTRYVGKMIASSGREKSKLTGQRTTLLSEIINGVKAIKFFAWESEFIRKIQDVRESEQTTLRVMSNLIISSLTITLASPTIVVCIVFIVYAYLNPTGLDPLSVFPAMILLNMLRTVLYNLPQYQAKFVSARISMKRLTEYLLLPEVDDSNVDNTNLPLGTVSIQSGNFAWAKGSSLTLSNVNLEIKPSRITAVVGEVGSGKSSLALSLLGEIEKVSGKVTFNGRIAYVPQQAWIMNATLRDNILFGKPFDQKFYDMAIETCCLKPDLEILEKGDMTWIGDKGINLSGGQKQRVSLARAVYAQADIYILDDPLSAVDSHVGKSLFNNCINGLLKNKTRLFITNQVQYVQFCDSVVHVSKGSIVAQGDTPTILEKINFGSIEESDRKDKEKRKEKEKEKEREKDRKEKKDKKSSKSSRSKKMNRKDSKKLLKQDENEDENENENENELNEQEENENENGAVTRNNRIKENDEEEEEEENDEQEEEEEEEEDEELKKEVEAIKNEVVKRPDLVSQPSGNLLIQMNKKAEKELKKKKKAEKKESVNHMGLFIKALGGGGWFTFILIIQIISTVTIMAEYLILGFWSIKIIPGFSREEYIGIFCGVSGAYMVAQITRSIFFARSTEHTARKTHKQLLARVLRAPVSFFDATPAGEILGWFTKDMTLLDITLHTTTELTFVVTFAGLFYLIFLPINFPWIAILYPFFVFYLYYLTYYYGPALVQIKKIDSISCPPIYSQFNETLDGLSSIRAYRAQDIFLKESRSKVDANNKALYHLCGLDHWIGFNIDMSGVVLSLLLCIFIVLSKEFKGFINNRISFSSNDPDIDLVQALTMKSVNASISLYLAIGVTGTVNYMVRNIVETARILERYDALLKISNMKVEAPAVIESNRPPEEWPQKGHLEFKNVVLRYRPEFDPVLKGITCTIKAGERIGIVGRTGAGKSSLMTTLFRLVEMSEGSIVLDGIDISTIGLDDLRSKLSIINQDPVLFSGTVRSNLDPFHKFSDDKIWESLELALLKPSIEALPGKLEARVSVNGENFSVGQRQQFALARALLKKPKLLIMDEATSSIDNDTDALIQKAIRKACSNTTVLTIAHRLNTIMDSDRVMVLDRGKISELDTPLSLLDNPNSIFYSMVQATGPSMSKTLYKMAKRASRKSKNKK